MPIPCNPYAGDKCNTIRLQTSESVDKYYFAPVIGINDGNTGFGQRRVMQGRMRGPFEPGRHRDGA